MPKTKVKQCKAAKCWLSLGPTRTDAITFKYTVDTLQTVDFYTCKVTGREHLVWAEVSAGGAPGSESVYIYIYASLRIQLLGARVMT